MNKWLQIDAEQNEEWLRKQGTGTYIDLSTIKKGDLPGQVILEKHNGYKEVLNKAALDKSKEIAAEGIVSWSAANWMESEYPYLTRKEAEAIGKNLVKKASPLVAGAFYLYGIQENHERFKSPYNAFRADILDVLPIVAGGGAAVIGGFAGPTGAIAAGVLAGGELQPMKLRPLSKSWKLWRTKKMTKILNGRLENESFFRKYRI